MSDGQLNVDLRLLLTKLRADVDQASKIIRDGLSKTVNVGKSQARGTKDTSDAMGGLEVKTKRVTAALKEQYDTWKRLQNFRKPVISIYGQTAMPKIDYSSYGPTMNPTQGPMGPGGGLATPTPYIGGVPPLLPIPPKIGARAPSPTPAALNPQDIAMFWRRILTGGMGAFRGGAYGNIIAGNQLFGAFSQTTTGGRAMGAVGLAGAGGAAVATGAVLVLVAALKGLQVVVQQSIAASERARQLYAQSLQNGLGLGLNAQRNNLAAVMGVSQEQVYQFGAMLNILNPRLEWASKTTAASAQAIAPLSYELKILKIDFEALFTQVAVDVVPAITRVVNVFDSLVKISSIYYANLREGLEITMALASLTPGAGVALDMVKKILDGFTNPVSALPNPQSFMKQLPVSALERMGLVAGMSSGGLVDYSKRTAVATEKMERLLSGRGGSGNGVPRNSLGFNPNVSNP